MNARQASVVGAVIVVLLGLLYFEHQRVNAPQTEAFAPAQSADEEVPVADTPIEPPAALTETPATAEEKSGGESEAMASADAVPAEETAAEQAMDAPSAAETEPDTPALAGMEAESQPAAPAEETPVMAASEPEVASEGLDRQTPAVEPGQMASEDAEHVTASEDAEPEAPASDIAAAQPAAEQPALDRQTPAVEPDQMAAAGGEAAGSQADAAGADAMKQPETATAEAPAPATEGASATETAMAEASERATEETSATETAMAEAGEPATEDTSAAKTAMASPDEEADGETAAAGPATEEPPSATSDQVAAASPEASTETPARHEDASSAAAAASTGDQPTMTSGGTAETEAASTDQAQSDEVQIAVVESEPQEAAPAGGAMGEPGVVPSFDVVRIEPTGDAVMAGQAEPGSMVEVMDGSDVIASAPSNERGEWALVLDQPLQPGTHDLAIRATSEDEAAVSLSDQRVSVSVPEQTTEEALVVLNSPDAPSRILQMPEAEAQETDVAMAGDSASGTQDQEPAETETAMASSLEAGEGTPAGTEAQTPGSEAAATEEPTPAAPESVPQVGVAAVEADTSGSLFVAGTAETDATVRVYVDDEFVGEAEPSESGTWLVEAKRDLPEGTYSVRADQVEEGSGTVLARAEVPFEREIEVASLKPMVASNAGETTEVAAAVPAPETIIIRRGDNLWRIARRMYGHGIRYSTIYQANKEQIRNPHWIYPGQVFMLPQGDTNWKN